MPLKAHFQGRGEEVMKSMMRSYGPEKAKRVFYATDNARKGGKKSENPYRALRDRKG